MDFTRQRQIFDPTTFLWSIHLIGCGNIGSAVALALAKLGVSELFIWDGDVVEEVNCAGQVLFGPKHIGMAKVSAARVMLQELAPWTRVITNQQQYTGQPLHGVVISAVDSMTSRSAIWQQVRMNVEVPWFVDSRVGGQLGECFTIRPCMIGDVEIYEGFLFPDTEALHLPCGAQAIVSTAFFIAAIVACQLIRLSRGEAYARRLLFNLPRMELITDGQVTATGATRAKGGE